MSAQQEFRFHAPSKPRRMSAAASIIERLKLGPATSHELMRLGGLNYRARVSDARRLGFDIVCRAHPTQDGINLYTLKEARHGA